MGDWGPAPWLSPGPREGHKWPCTRAHTHKLTKTLFFCKLKKTPFLNFFSNLFLLSTLITSSPWNIESVREGIGIFPMKIQGKNKTLRMRSRKRRPMEARAAKHRFLPTNKLTTCFTMNRNAAKNVCLEDDDEEDNARRMFLGRRKKTAFRKTRMKRIGRTKMFRRIFMIFCFLQPNHRWRLTAIITLLLIQSEKVSGEIMSDQHCWWSEGLDLHIINFKIKAQIAFYELSLRAVLPMALSCSLQD